MKSDRYMKYDLQCHRYILTEDFCREKLNISLHEILDTSFSSDAGNAISNFLNRVSALIYNRIYSVNFYRNETERMLALDESLRPYIQDAMMFQVEYMIQNGDLSQLSGVNMSSGFSIDLKRIRQSEVSPIANDILENSGILNPAIIRFKKDASPTYEEDEY